MSSRIYTITVDAVDPARLGAFWSQALAYTHGYDQGDEVVIEPADGNEPALLFIRVPDAKTVKNRLHLDLAPDDQDAEVARLLEIGATHVDIGQGDTSWVVLADPEGNEFCVLTPRGD